jgi:hypothetical protein
MQCCPVPRRCLALIHFCGSDRLTIAWLLPLCVRPLHRGVSRYAAQASPLHGPYFHAGTHSDSLCPFPRANFPRHTRSRITTCYAWGCAAGALNSSLLCAGPAPRVDYDASGSSRCRCSLTSASSLSRPCSHPCPCTCVRFHVNDLRLSLHRGCPSVHPGVVHSTSPAHLPSGEASALIDIVSPTYPAAALTLHSSLLQLGTTSSPMLPCRIVPPPNGAA